MNIQIFGASKSFDTRKAERWFKERRIKYQYIDVPSKGLSPREYQSVKQKVGFEALVDTRSRAYEAHYMAYLTPEAREEKLLEHPELFAESPQALEIFRSMTAELTKRTRNNPGKAPDAYAALLRALVRSRDARSAEAGFRFCVRQTLYDGKERH